MAEMLKGGVIMDVVTPEQARIAEGPAPWRSWRWNGSLPTSALRAACRG
ncbi:SOR/SNZ family protein [Mycobacterium xenopi 3993]|nr:SOR/SNZ family protein [Mycobacterium xenopi 3993]